MSKLPEAAPERWPNLEDCPRYPMYCDCEPSCATCGFGEHTQLHTIEHPFTVHQPPEQNLEDKNSGGRCTCGHRCPSKQEWMDGAQCVHAEDCELMQTKASSCSQIVIEKDSSESADHTCEWRVQHENLLAVKEQDNAALLKRCDNAAEFFCHWLARAYEAEARDTSYEEGETLREVMRQVNQVLGFAGFEPESSARRLLLSKSFSWECDYSPVSEVKRRTDAVVEAAVEWYEAGREGKEWGLNEAEVLDNAIESLLELREKPVTESSEASHNPELSQDGQASFTNSESSESQSTLVTVDEAARRAAEKILDDERFSIWEKIPRREEFVQQFAEIIAAEPVYQPDVEFDAEAYLQSQGIEIRADRVLWAKFIATKPTVEQINLAAQLALEERSRVAPDVQAADMEAERDTLRKWMKRALREGRHGPMCDRARCVCWKAEARAALAASPVQPEVSKEQQK